VLQAEVSPESKPSLKRASPPRIVNGSGVVATTTYDWRAPLDSCDLWSRKRSPELVRARELLMVLGVEGYRLKVREIAATLKKTSDGMSHALARGVRRRSEDERFRSTSGSWTV